VWTSLRRVPNSGILLFFGSSFAEKIASSIMKHSPPGPIHAAIRVLLLEWLAIVLVLPAAAFALGHLARLSSVEIWHNVILAPRNLLILPLTLLIAGRTWFAYKFEGEGKPRRQRKRAA
jgi:hypothetical protein